MNFVGNLLLFAAVKEFYKSIKETTKMNAYSLGGRELEPIGVSPFL